MILNIDEIKSAASIKDVLSHYGVSLNSRNAAPCPVHGGKHLNFTVKNQIATCWSVCGGKTWDAIGFIMDYKKIDFYDAIIELASISKTEVRYDKDIDIDAFKEQRRKEYLERESIRITNEAYLKLITSDLEDTFKAMPGDNVLIAGRSLSVKTMATWDIGFSKDTSLLENISQTALLQSGLIKEGENGMYDTFRQRTMFPIRDERGQLVGFTGRTDSDNKDVAKYLNSLENPLFHKSKVLFGLFQNAITIQRMGYAVLVEGQMDVISLFDHGIDYAIAGSGTAFSVDQAKLLSRYTDRVVIMYDGDDAGKKATYSAVPKLLKAGLAVSICDLPPSSDPDSLVREKGADYMIDLIQNKAADAVYRIMTEHYVESDPFAVEKALNETVRILKCIESDTVRSSYLNMLKGKGKPGTNFIKAAQRALKDVDQSEQSERGIHLTSSQKSDIIRYGVYENESKYFLCSDTRTGLGIELSNFIIKPILLIIGSERSQRIVEVCNEHGHSFISAIGSDDFVELVSFKKQMERRGNFIYKGKPEQFINIKEKVYMQTPEAYPITTLGLHKSGYYVWANGATDLTGHFHPTDEYGIVEIEGLKYFLPAFSKIYKNIMSDDQDNSYETDREFIYQSGDCPDLFAWSEEIRAVFGDAGMMAMSWYFAALFRDVIYHRANYFPHLNLFGPPRSGKSYMGWAISSMFGRAKKPFHLMQGTNVGFYRRAAQTRNAVAWYDEYSNDLDIKRVEALKSGYDGVGHEKGVMSSDNRTVTTSINSAFIISGQHQTTKDVALFTRCITLSFSVQEYTEAADQRAKKLLKIQESGVLSQLTSRLHKYRHTIDVRWNRMNDEVQQSLKSALPHIDARMIGNYSIPLTVLRLILEHERLAWSYEELFSWTVANMTHQHQAIAHDDEIQVWWRIFTFALAETELSHEQDVIVEYTSRVSVRSETDKEKQVLHEWETPKKLIFIRFHKSFPKYQEMHKRQYSKSGLSIGSLQHYLRHSKAYIGETKAKRFKEGIRGAWVFDADVIGLEISTTAEALAVYSHIPVNVIDPIVTDDSTKPPF
jgi:DNA primase